MALWLCNSRSFPRMPPSFNPFTPRTLILVSFAAFPSPLSRIEVIKKVKVRWLIEWWWQTSWPYALQDKDAIVPFVFDVRLPGAPGWGWDAVPTPLSMCALPPIDHCVRGCRSKGRVHDEDKGNIRPSLTSAREEEDYGSRYCGALHVCARLACVWHVGNDINLLAHCTHNTLVSFQVRWQR